MEETVKKYLYFRIPATYIEVYKKIILLLSEYGVDMLRDCAYSCKDRNKNIIDCYNIFISALAAYNSNQLKLADTIIKYLEAKIKQLYGNINTDDIILDFELENESQEPNEDNYIDYSLLDIDNKVLITEDNKILLFSNDDTTSILDTALTNSNDEILIEATDKVLIVNQ